MGISHPAVCTPPVLKIKGTRRRIMDCPLCQSADESDGAGGGYSVTAMVKRRSGRE